MTESLKMKFDESQSNDGTSTDGNEHDTELCDSTLSSTETEGGLLYRLRQKPSTILSIFLGLQVVIIITFSVIWVPLSIASSLCIHPDDIARVEIISLSLFTSGISTLLFSTVGLRLPVIMAPNTNFIYSILNVLKHPELKCPGAGDLYAMGPHNRSLEWRSRINIIQGGLLILSLLQFFIGITGISALFDRMLSNPLVLIPTTIVIGFSYASQIMNVTSTSDVFAETTVTSQWGVALLTVSIIIIAGFKFQNLDFFYPSYTHKDGFSITYLKVFKMFPVLVASIFVLIIYPSLLAVLNGRNGSEKILLKHPFENSASFLIHFPFSFGWPSFRADAFLFLLPAAVIQIVESIVIYRVTNFIYGQDIKRKYINLGITVESCTSFIAGIFGMTITSSPVNIGIMQLTGVGSRWIIQLSGVLLILFSFSATLLRFLVGLTPIFILSTVFLISALISVVGFSMMQRVNMNSVRAFTVIGLTIYSTIVIPKVVPNIASEYKIVQVLSEIFSSNIIMCIQFASMFDCVLPRSRQNDSQEELDTEKKKEEQGPSFCEELFSVCLC